MTNTLKSCQLFSMPIWDVIEVEEPRHVGTLLEHMLKTGSYVNSGKTYRSPSYTVKKDMYNIICFTNGDSKIVFKVTEAAITFEYMPENQYNVVFTGGLKSCEYADYLKACVKTLNRPKLSDFITVE